MSVMQVYNNNKNLKAAGVAVEFTREQIEEYVKCKNDPIYFIKNYAKIVSLDDGVVPFDPFPYQERMIEAIHTNKNTLGKLFRQAGKSTIVAAYFAWYVLFNDNKTAVILANKQAIAIEIFGRVQFIIENIPQWLQQGVVTWNKGNVELENGSKIIAASTSSSAIRGGAFNCVDGKSMTRISVAGKKIEISMEDLYSKISNMDRIRL
jgi:phage terminase large subunit-like protein